MKNFLILLLTLPSINFVFNQNIQAGFDAKEMEELLLVSCHQMDKNKWGTLQEVPLLDSSYQLKYRSKVVGMDNRWDLFQHGDQVIISLRGSVGTMLSWMGNFYAGMIPAEGKLLVSDSTYFNYKLSETPNSFVHIGWTLALSSFGEDIIKKIKEYKNEGIHDFYIIGHSQGGALAQLLRSYLEYHPDQITKDIRIKTYAFACPKVGNYNYSMDYAKLNRGGWEYRVIIDEDWVPTVPFSAQTLEDVPGNNPIKILPGILKRMKPIQRMFVKGIYKKLDRKLNVSSRYLNSLFGKKIQFILGRKKSFIKEHVVKGPTDYFPAGSPIVLEGIRIPETASPMEKVFYNHMPSKYLQAVHENFPETKTTN